MEKTGKNRKQLASYLGVSSGYVSQVLNGDYDHRISKLVELSMSFGYIPKIDFIPLDQVISEDIFFHTSYTITNDQSMTIYQSPTKQEKELREAA